MKRGKVLLCSVLAVLLLVPSVLAAWPQIPDLQGHWAQAGVEKAVKDCWVNGYPDGTFRPDATITRAEFVKLILNAMYLTPGRNPDTWFREAACTPQQQPDGSYQLVPYKPDKFQDMDTNWLTTQGWLDTALAFGMVVPSDYNNHMFRPSKPITRYEISVMVDRAMGKVYPATQPLKEELSFSDADQIPEWVRGYIHEAVQAGVITGYPDGTFGHSKPATRAEAVIMVQRMLDYTREGYIEPISPSVNLTLEYSIPNDFPGAIYQRKERHFPVQIVDGVVYASIRNLINRQDRMLSGSTSIHWDPIWQQLFVEMDRLSQYRLGTASYGYFDSYQELLDSNADHHFCAPVRIRDGNIMIPIVNPGTPDDGWNGSWDKETNTITLPVFCPGFYEF